MDPSGAGGAAGLWGYVFSPRLMAIDGVCGLAAGVVVFLLRGDLTLSVRRSLAVMVLASAIRHQFFAAPGFSAPPVGYVGDLVRMCEHSDEARDCRCAVDALEQRIGHPALVQLGVRAVANERLPPDFVAAVADCRG